MTSTGAQLVFLRDSEDGILDDIYATFFSKIKDQVSTVDVDFTTTKDIFKDITLQIVLVVGGELTKKLYSGLHSQLARFAKDGGAVICCCNVSSFCLPGDLKDFFGTFGLQWTSGDYHRTDHVLNEAFKLTFGASAFAELKPTYSQKALHLNHVPFNCRIYGPTSDSRTQSRVFPPMAVNHSQSSAVLGTCGKGYVGYVGDVNNEEGSQILLMALIQITLKSSARAEDLPVAGASSGEASNGDGQTGAPFGSNQGCQMCGAFQPIQRCGACHRVQYCSASCQKVDWKAHKRTCTGKVRS